MNGIKNSLKKAFIMGLLITFSHGVDAKQVCCPSGTVAYCGECCSQACDSEGKCPSDCPNGGNADVFDGVCCKNGRVYSLKNGELGYHDWDLYRCKCPEDGDLSTSGQNCCKDRLMYDKQANAYILAGESDCACPKRGILSDDGMVCCKDGRAYSHTDEDYTLEYPYYCGCPEGKVVTQMGCCKQERYNPTNGICCAATAFPDAYQDDNGQIKYQCCDTSEHAIKEFSCCPDIRTGWYDKEGNPNRKFCCSDEEYASPIPGTQRDICCPGGSVAQPYTDSSGDISGKCCSSLEYAIYDSASDKAYCCPNEDDRIVGGKCCTIDDAQCNCPNGNWIGEVCCSKTVSGMDVDGNQNAMCCNDGDYGVLCCETNEGKWKDGACCKASEDGSTILGGGATMAGDFDSSCCLDTETATHGGCCTSGETKTLVYGSTTESYCCPSSKSDFVTDDGVCCSTAMGESYGNTDDQHACYCAIHSGAGECQTGCSSNEKMCSDGSCTLTCCDEELTSDEKDSNCYKCDTKTHKWVALSNYKYCVATKTCASSSSCCYDGEADSACYDAFLADLFATHEEGYTGYMCTCNDDGLFHMGPDNTWSDLEYGDAIPIPTPVAYQ